LAADFCSLFPFGTVAKENDSSGSSCPNDLRRRWLTASLDTSAQLLHPKGKEPHSPGRRTCTTEKCGRAPPGELYQWSLDKHSADGLIAPLPVPYAGRCAAEWKTAFSYQSAASTCAFVAPLSPRLWLRISRRWGSSDRNMLEGRSKATADAIAEQLRIRFQDRGWISSGRRRGALKCGCFDTDRLVATARALHDRRPKMRSCWVGPIFWLGSRRCREN